MTTRRLTTAQALVEFLVQQRVERDGAEHPLFAGCLGILGHGNLAGIGQAIQQNGALRYIPARNEQAMVHVAAGFAKASNRLRTFACTTSIGPGATNMVTAAAGATINRLPVLLLPGDVFATRRADPVLQQLEVPWAGDVSVNDALRPVSRYFDRIQRPEQLASSLLHAMRVLTDQAETGAVTIALPQDVQTEGWDFPEALFAPRTWHIRRTPAADGAVQDAIATIRAARRPLIVAGGGAIYSAATEELCTLCDATGIPVCETQAGKGSLRFDHPCNVGAIGATGARAANRCAREADVVIGIGTRYSDFTTASRTAFQDPDVRFVNLNVAEFDADKHAGLALVGDARATMRSLRDGLAEWSVDRSWSDRYGEWRDGWGAEVEGLYAGQGGSTLTQSQVIGLVEEAAGEDGVVVCAAGSMPGDLHKLWRARHSKSYQLEYGYSCMGYEIPGAIGVKLAAPDRHVFALVGDGSWLMMPGEVVTAIQERVAVTIVLVDNRGYGSIGGLSEALGSEGFGTHLRSAPDNGAESGEPIAIDFEACARSLGARAATARTPEELEAALATARACDTATVIVVPLDAEPRVPSFESWWDVPVAEVSSMPSVQRARQHSDEARTRQRPLI